MHFGGFARHYVNGKFFSDLHPPLARLLVTLSAWLGGFDGQFSFYDIGADYLKPAVPYVLMRAFPALLGALVVPVAYATLRFMNVSFWTACAVAGMVAVDNALMTQSRLILLDSYLVFFTTLAGMCWMGWRRTGDDRWLAGVGVAMGCAASCKWVGLFVVGGVGLFSAVSVWQMWGDKTLPLGRMARVVCKRLVALLVLPLLVYAGSFWIHFYLLRTASAAAASMSVEFQQTLSGGELPATMRQVFFGSTVRIRQHRSEGPYLHSHIHLYPAGSKQQQVTGYHHRDANNLWTIRRAYAINITYSDADGPGEEADLLPLRHGDTVRLQHVATGRFLHSHPVDAPVSHKEHHWEISGYGHHPSNFSDTNDNWTVQIVDKLGDSVTGSDGEDPAAGKPFVEAIGVRFKLVHANLGCGLHARNKALPEWGFKQIEMTCGRDTLRRNMVWQIEHNVHPKADATAVPKVSYARSSFWSKLVEMNQRMWDTNAGLSADHPFASRPESWPFLWRGLGFWNGNHVPKTERGWRRSKALNGEVQVESEDLSESKAEEAAEHARLTQEYAKFKGQQIYLLGNPVVWWSSSLAVVGYIGLLVVCRLAVRLGVGQVVVGAVLPHIELGSNASFLFFQWFFHFVPFFGMHRQLFLHHYLPALYFSVLLLGLLLDSGLARVRSQRARQVGLGVLVVASVYAFVRFAPLGYGLAMTRSQCMKLKWRSRWDFDCGALVDSVVGAATTSGTG